jgi:hypothetical protein
MPDSSRRTDGHASLHALLLSGDATAGEAITVEMMPLLERWLRRSFRNAARDAIVDAVEDALIEYIARPQRFDPERGVPLHAYLRLAAARNLQNRLRSDARRAVREQQYAADLERQSTSKQVPELAPLSKRSAILTCERAEVAAARAWLHGERRTEPLAKLLGVSNLADGERRRAVKQFKDRLLKRIERLQRQKHATKEKKSHG